MNTSDSPWRTSSYSSGGQTTCVEVAAGQGSALVRDTTDRQGPMLAITPTAWMQFLAAIR